jgi:hypothetical protein
MDSGMLPNLSGWASCSNRKMNEEVKRSAVTIIKTAAVSARD